jgi:hypothetical protein
MGVAVVAGRPHYLGHLLRRGLHGNEVPGGIDLGIGLVYLKKLDDQQRAAGNQQRALDFLIHVLSILAW